MFIAAKVPKPTARNAANAISTNGRRDRQNAIKLRIMEITPAESGGSVKV
jgi:hypothetical protein